MINVGSTFFQCKVHSNQNISIPTESGDKKSGLNAKERITENLNMKLTECEQLKEKYLLIDKRISKLPDGPERRKLIYQKNMREKEEKRKNKGPVDVERQLHESYQMVLKVYFKSIFWV